VRSHVLRDRLLAAPLSDVPGIIAEVKPYRNWIDPLLRQAYGEAEKAGNAQKQLNAALGLFPVDDAQLPYLKARLLRADPCDISIVGRLLARYRDSLAAECWQVLEKPAPEDRGKAIPEASVLAMYDPQNPRWASVRIDVANRLVAENAYVIAGWIDNLRPVAPQLIDPLNAVFHDEKRGESERTLWACSISAATCGSGVRSDRTSSRKTTTRPRPVLILHRFLSILKTLDFCSAVRLATCRATCARAAALGSRCKTATRQWVSARQGQMTEVPSRGWLSATSNATHCNRGRSHSVELTTGTDLH